MHIGSRSIGGMRRPRAQMDRCSPKPLDFILEREEKRLERGFGWCYKAKLNGKPIDCFFPEEQGGEYAENEETDFGLNDEAMFG